MLIFKNTKELTAAPEVRAGGLWRGHPPDSNGGTAMSKWLPAPGRFPSAIVAIAQDRQRKRTESPGGDQHRHAAKQPPGGGMPQAPSAMAAPISRSQRQG